MDIEFALGVEHVNCVSFILGSVVPVRCHVSVTELSYGGMLYLCLQGMRVSGLRVYM